MKIDSNIVKAFKSLPEDKQQEITKKYLVTLGYCGEHVHLEYVKRNGNYIQYIKNPSEKVQLAAIREVRHAIRFIKNPTKLVKQLHDKLEAIWGNR